jgi:hypothetical protein
MAISKLRSESIDLTDDYAFTGTVTGAGSVLQVVEAVNNTNFSSTSTSFVDAGMDVTITPSSTSSKILILGSINLGSASNGLAVIGTIYADDTTNLGDSTNGLARHDDTGQGATNHSVVALHSASTTSAVKYSVYTKQSGAGTHHFNLNSAESTLIAMEIAG